MKKRNTQHLQREYFTASFGGVCECDACPFHTGALASSAKYVASWSMISAFHFTTATILRRKLRKPNIPKQTHYKLEK
jgi:hypothetical protein